MRCGSVASLSAVLVLAIGSYRMSGQDCQEHMQVPCTPACTPVPCVCFLTAFLREPGLRFL